MTSIRLSASTVEQTTVTCSNGNRSAVRSGGYVTVGVLPFDEHVDVMADRMVRYIDV